MKKIFYIFIFFLLNIKVLFASEVNQAKENTFPQFDFKTYPEQIIWFSIIFLSLYYFIKQYVIPKIESIQNSRERLISQNYSNHRENNIEANKIKNIIALQVKEYEKNTSIILKNLMKELQEVEEKKIKTVKEKNSLLKEQHDKENDKLEKDFYKNINTSIYDIITLTMFKLDIVIPKEIIKQETNKLSLTGHSKND